MREHKYQAWQKHHKEMFEVGAIQFREPRFVVKKDSSETWTFDEVELREFTGLHDKQGKEIYEGDIVHYEYHNALFEVQWCDGKGEWLRSQVGWHLISGDYTVEFEAHLEVHEFDQEEYFNGSVIGNIYENPELMPKENN